MKSQRVKVLAAMITVALLAQLQTAYSQTMPPPGGTTMPPPDGTTAPPPGGTTMPPPGGTTTPPPGGTTMPPPGGTTTPPPGGTTTPPPGGTTMPPPGGTTMPPPGGTTGTSCYIPVPGAPIPAGVQVCSNISMPTSGSTGIDPSTFFKSVTLDQLGGMGADQLLKFDPAAASGFSASQLGALSPDAMKGISPDLIKNLTGPAITGLKDTQIAAMKPDAIKGFTPDQIKNLPTQAVAGFTSNQIAGMLPTQLASMKTDQFSNLNPTAMSGLTPDQFKALPGSLVGAMDTSKLAALDPSVFKSMDPTMLAQLNPTAVKSMGSQDVAEMLVNLNKQTVTAADVKALLPAGWNVDDKTGKVIAPPGANLAVQTTSGSSANPGVTMPSVPNLNTGMAIGGDTTAGTIIEGMQKALESAGLAGYNMTQTNGVLKVEGTGSQASTRLAFIPDGNGIKQAPTGTPPGLTRNAEGKYVLTTPEGMQVPVIPALTSPESLAKLSPGAKVEVGKEGNTKITQTGQNPVVGIPDPTVIPTTQAPGIYRTGTGASAQVTVVYENGTAQTMKPSIQDPTEFREATKAFPQVKDVTIGTDGVIRINYNGQPLELKPAFDVQATTGTGGAPGITQVNATTFRFTNSKGESQEFYVGGG